MCFCDLLVVGQRSIHENGLRSKYCEPVAEDKVVRRGIGGQIDVESSNLTLCSAEVQDILR